jgi:hypothetical protein
LDGVVGIKSVRDPMFTLIVSTSCYLHFVSYAVTLTAFYAIGLHWRRLNSSIKPWVCGAVSLDVHSVSYIVDDVGSGAGWSVCWGINCRVGWSISCSIAVGLTGCTTSFSPCPSSATGSRGPGYGVVGEDVSALGIGICCGSTVSKTSFFDLGSGDTDVSLKTSYLRRIFEVV